MQQRLAIMEDESIPTFRKETKFDPPKMQYAQTQEVVFLQEAKFQDRYSEQKRYEAVTGVRGVQTSLKATPAVGETVRAVGTAVGTAVQTAVEVGTAVQSQVKTAVEVGKAVVAVGTTVVRTVQTVATTVKIITSFFQIMQQVLESIDQFHRLLKQLENSQEKEKFMMTNVEKGSTKKTIGYGHQCSKEEEQKFKDGISESEAHELYKKDFDRCQVEAKATYNKIYATSSNPDPFSQLTKGFQLLMTEIDFNLGPNGLKKYVKLMKFASEGKFYEAVNENARGCSYDPSLDKGLANRTKKLQDFFKQNFDSDGNEK